MASQATKVQQMKKDDISQIVAGIVSGIRSRCWCATAKKAKDGTVEVTFRYFPDCDFSGKKVTHKYRVIVKRI